MGTIISAIIGTAIIMVIIMNLLGVELGFYIGAPAIIVGAVVAVGLIIHEDIKELKEQMDSYNKKED